MASHPQVAASTVSQQQEPLIINGDVEAQARAKDKVSYSSLPNKKQLAILCIARLADPLAASSIQVRLLQSIYPHSSNKQDIHVLSATVFQSVSIRISDIYPGWHYCGVEDCSTSLHRDVVGSLSRLGVRWAEDGLGDWLGVLWCVSTANFSNYINSPRNRMHWLRIIENFHLCGSMAGFWRCHE
jgi:hypothetical protein